MTFGVGYSPVSGCILGGPLRRDGTIGNGSDVTDDAVWAVIQLVGDSKDVAMRGYRITVSREVPE